MGPAIRSARLSDTSPVVTLWRSLDDVLPSVTDDEAAVRALLEHDPESLLVADLAGTVVATIIVGWDGWRGNLYRLAVDPAHRRSGVASGLLDEAERRLAALGCRRIAAAVAVEEKHAVGFWSAAGYSLGDGIGRFVKTVGATSRLHAA
jgi:ribosomal protein S18 acetylase RimI-like enzyme